ncbi:MAG: HAD family hydrolase [Bacillota bacterium]
MAIRLAVFDLDGTLLAGSKTVMPVLAAHMWEAGFRRPQGVLRFGMAGLAGVGRKLRLLSREGYTEYGTRLILGWLAGLRPEEAAPFFRESARRLLASARTSTAGEIGLRQQEGYRTVILSATIQPFLEEIARHLNCAAVGTPIALTPDGRITGDLAGPYCSGPGKLTTLQRWAERLEQPVDWEGSVAYGDTMPDLPVLEAVGTAVAVAPEPALLSIATQRGWRLLDG